MKNSSLLDGEVDEALPNDSDFKEVRIDEESEMFDRETESMGKNAATADVSSIHDSSRLIIIAPRCRY